MESTLSPGAVPLVLMVLLKKRILWQRDRLGEKVSATEADNLDPVLWDLRKNERTKIVL